MKLVVLFAGVMLAACGAEFDVAGQGLDGCPSGSVLYLDVCTPLGTPVTDHPTRPPSRCVVTNAEGFGDCLKPGSVVTDHTASPSTTCVVDPDGTCN